MTRDEMLADLKEVLGETDNDVAWGDPRLLDMLAEGQDQFCEDTGFFVDRSTADICEFNSVIGIDSYELSDRIIKVLGVFQGTTKLGKYNENDKYLYQKTATALDFPANAQQPYAWQTDEETGWVRLYPTPVEALTYTMRVWRYSKKWLADTQVEPEIRRQSHRACIEWAAFLALSDHDFEKQDDIKAADHLAAYTMYKNRGVKAFNRMRGGETTVDPNSAYIVDC